MNNGFLWGDGWDDPERLSPTEGCDLKHFVSASRSLRDALNTKLLQANSNADIRLLANSNSQIDMPWRQYVDPAASRSNGKSSGTAIVLWECAEHVLTCVKRRGKWTLLEGDQTEDMIDVIDNPNATPQQTQDDLDITSSGEISEDLDVVFADDEVVHSDYNRENPDFHEIEELIHNPDDDIDEVDEDLRIQKEISSQVSDEENLSIDSPINDSRKTKELMEEIEELKEELLHSELSFEQDRLSLIEQLKIALDLKVSHEQQIAELREKLHQSREIESELRYQLSRLNNAHRVDIDDEDVQAGESLPLLRQLNLELTSELEFIKEETKDLEIEMKMKQMEGIQREKDLVSRAKNAEREFKNLQSEMRRNSKENQIIIDRLKTEIQHLKVNLASSQESLNVNALPAKSSVKKTRKHFFSLRQPTNSRSKKTQKRATRKQ